MGTALITLAILALRPDWQPGACEHAYADGPVGESARAACEERRDEGSAFATEIAGYLDEEIRRQGLEGVWKWVIAVISKESAFERGDLCPAKVALDRVVSRELLDEESGKTRLCWRYRVASDDRPNGGINCQPVFVEDEYTAPDGTEYLIVDRCAAGEVGLFQLVGGEVGAGVEVPATGATLPRNRLERRRMALDPRTNVSLGVAALRAHRDRCCGDDQECLSDPTRWIGSYNTGSCVGQSGRGYARRVGALVEDIDQFLEGIETTEQGDTDQVDTEQGTDH